MANSRLSAGKRYGGQSGERRELREERLSRFADRTMLPKDIVTGSCCVTVTGQNEIVIENYKSILEYSPEKLVVQTKRCRVEVQGKRLEILYYAREEMKVRGRIESICYKSIGNDR